MGYLASHLGEASAVALDASDVDDIIGEFWTEAAPAEGWGAAGERMEGAHVLVHWRREGVDDVPCAGGYVRRPQVEELLYGGAV